MSYSFDSDDFDGCRFDEFLNLPQAERDALLEALRPICDEGRQRGRTVHGITRLGHTLGLIAANALLAKSAERGPACFYSRARSTYSSNGAYNPPWLTYRVLIDTIDKLTAAGLLEGVRSRATGFGDSPRSTFEATDHLIGLLGGLEISAAGVARDEAAAPVLVLKGEAIRNTKPWLQYPRNALHIQALDQPVRAFNAFLREQQLDWAAPNEAVAALAQKEDEYRRRIGHPNPARRNLRRVFNDGSWQRGGRFYGGWWQALPADLRQHVRINDEPVVELDFGGFLPRAIYHQSNLDLPGDAYDIPEIRQRAEQQAMDWGGVVRPSVKKLMAVILNGSKPESRIGGIDLPKGLRKKRAYELIEAHHLPISEWFYKGRGVEIMNAESEICQRILSEGVEAGVAVLPVHDSFIVPASQEAWLRELMDRAYFDRFNRHPVIN
ncbi:hypothetical protein [Phenylobacterium sp.]|uniref:hypothetical protein n=1 Tax=Phenylobacterium sp. TaxID=1871053 RepID=UPI002DE726B9|nr:hypothetical protein [Phenylobacterium sp.]